MSKLGHWKIRYREVMVSGIFENRIKDPSKGWVPLKKNFTDRYIDVAKKNIKIDPKIRLTFEFRRLEPITNSIEKTDKAHIMFIISLFNVYFGSSLSSWLSVVITL